MAKVYHLCRVECLTVHRHFTGFNEMDRNFTGAK